MKSWGLSESGHPAGTAVLTSTRILSGAEGSPALVGLDLSRVEDVELRHTRLVVADIEVVRLAAEGLKIPL